MSKIFAAQINKLPDNKELSAVLEYLCSESNKLYNCTTYLARQIYFKTGRYANKFWLATQLKTNPHMKALYTSQASNLDLDDIPVYGERPEGWKASGRRVKRGLYRSAKGIEFNADINGAIGIARKVAGQYGFQFDARSFVRGVLTMPKRVKLWNSRISTV